MEEVFRTDLNDIAGQYEKKCLKYKTPKLPCLSKVGFMDVTIHKNKAWVCDMFFNALFQIDLATLKLKLLAILPSEYEYGHGQYGPIEYYDNKLIIAPKSADRILIYDLKCDSYIEIPIREYVKESFDILFFNSYIYENCLFLFPGKNRSILKLNLQTHEIKTIDGWYEEIKKDIKENRIIFFDLLELSNGLILLTCWQSGKALKFNMKTDEFEIIIFSGLGALSGCAGRDSELWLLERDFKSLSFYNQSNLKKIQVSLPDYQSNTGFRKIFLYNNQAFLFPLYGNMIIKLDLETGEKECVKKLKMEYVSTNEIPKWSFTNMTCCKKINSSEVLYYSVFEGKIVKYNMSTNMFFEKSADLDEEDYYTLQKYLYKKMFNRIEYEENVGLEQYMDFIHMRERWGNGCSVKIKTGQKIYEHCRWEE